MFKNVIISGNGFEGYKLHPSFWHHSTSNVKMKTNNILTAILAFLVFANACLLTGYLIDAHSRVSILDFQENQLRKYI